MRLTLGNLWTSVSSAPADEVRWLKKFLVFEDSARARVGDGTTSLLDTNRRRFPTGLVPLVYKSATEADIPVDRDDQRVRPHGQSWQSLVEAADLGWLKTRQVGPDKRPFQFDAVTAAIRSSRGIVRAPTGCHVKGQLVLTYDGRRVPVEDVHVGDLLIGPDGAPRQVLCLFRGRQHMVKVTPAIGEPWVVNLDHVLTIARRPDLDGMIDIKARDWLSVPEQDKRHYGLIRAVPHRVRGDSVAAGVSWVRFATEVLPYADDYFGFELDGDGRYLLGDYTVTHNSGKGEMAVGLCKAIPAKWLFLVHRSHLVDDIAKRWALRGSGHPAKRLRGGDWELGERFSYCTFKTLHQSLQDPACINALQHVQGVLVDEVHTLGATGNGEVMESLPNAFYRIGLSGSPYDRADGKNALVTAHTGPVVYNVTPRELMAAGYVAKASVRLSKVRQHSRSTSWHSVRRALISESHKRNTYVLRDIVRCAKPAIVLVDLIPHGKLLSRLAREMGFSATFVWGDAKKEKRQEVIARAKTGDLDVLVANAVFREGVDIPQLRAVIYACGGKAAIPVIQGAGRGSRVTEDKDEFEIYDYADVGQRWLETHAIERTGTYDNYGYDILDSHDSAEDHLFHRCAEVVSKILC